jgi:hypothetical protein
MKTILNPLAILLTASLLVGGCHRSPPATRFRLRGRARGGRPEP